MTIDLAAILEIFGIGGTAPVRVSESPNRADHRIAIEVETQTQRVASYATPTEARHLAGRLNYLADKVEKRAKAAKSCETCGAA